jgi:hypothetical protein
VVLVAGEPVAVEAATPAQLQEVVAGLRGTVR